MSVLLRFGRCPDSQRPVGPRRRPGRPHAWLLALVLGGAAWSVRAGPLPEAPAGAARPTVPSLSDSLAGAWRSLAARVQPARATGEDGPQDPRRDVPAEARREAGRDASAERSPRASADAAVDAASALLARLATLLPAGLPRVLAPNDGTPPGADAAAAAPAASTPSPSPAPAADPDPPRPGNVVLASAFLAAESEQSTRLARVEEAAPAAPVAAAPVAVAPAAAAPVAAAVPAAAEARPGRLHAWWREAGGLLDAVNPFAGVPTLPLVPTMAPADPAETRNLRLAELPGLVDLPMVLPVDGQRAAVPAGQPPLSLERAVALGLANSLEVRAAQARLASLRHGERATLGNLLPQLEARAAVGEGELQSVTPAEQRHRKEGTVALRQAVFDLPAWRELERQKALTAAAELQWQGAASEAALEVANTYVQALQARIALAMGERHEQQLVRLLAFVSERAQGGGTSQAERSRVQARVANARAQMAEAQASLRAALRRLSMLIGTPPEALAIDLPSSLRVPGTVEGAREEASRLNRELLAARAETVAFAYEAAGRRARLLPKLEVELTHARATNAGGSAGYTRDTRGMLVMNWQLYSGGSDLAQQRASLAREEERQLRADDLQRRVSQDLEAAYSALDSVAPRFASLREELLANTRVVSAFDAQLTSGNRQLLDVLDAYQRLHGNRLELASVVLGEVQNTVRVAHLTGRLGTVSAGPAR